MVLYICHSVSNSISCCRYLSEYHCLYGLPLIHQSKIASAISSSVHCPASTPPDAGLSENPLHCPLGNDILRVCCPLVVLQRCRGNLREVMCCPKHFPRCNVCCIQSLGMFHHINSSLNTPPLRISLIALIQFRFTWGKRSMSRCFDFGDDIGQSMQPIRLYPSS